MKIDIFIKIQGVVEEMFKELWIGMPETTVLAKFDPCVTITKLIIQQYMVYVHRSLNSPYTQNSFMQEQEL